MCSENGSGWNLLILSIKIPRSVNFLFGCVGLSWKHERKNPFNNISKTDFVFSFGDGSISVIDRYTYLDFVLREHLDYNIIVKCVAQSASRAHCQM